MFRRFQVVWTVSGFLQLPFQRLLAKQVRSTIKDPELAERLIPNYEVGCKRIAPNNEFLPTFNR